MLDAIMTALGMSNGRSKAKRKYRYKLVLGKRIVSKHYTKKSALKAKKRGYKLMPINKPIVRYKPVKKVRLKRRRRVKKSFRRR